MMPCFWSSLQWMVWLMEADFKQLSLEKHLKDIYGIVS